MFNLSDLHSIQIHFNIQRLEIKDVNIFNDYKLLDDLLGDLESLEELAINFMPFYDLDEDGAPGDVHCGHGQLIAETLQQVRQRCNLKISHGRSRQPVCWRHLFEQDAVVEDRNDYRERARNVLNQMERERVEQDEKWEKEKEERRKKEEETKKRQEFILP